jgi:hypothetical protein
METRLVLTAVLECTDEGFTGYIATMPEIQPVTGGRMTAVQQELGRRTEAYFESHFSGYSCILEYMILFPRHASAHPASRRRSQE